MRKYSVTVCEKTTEFEALNDDYVFEAVTEILSRPTFRDYGNAEAFQIEGPDGAVTGGHGTLGEIRGKKA